MEALQGIHPDIPTTRAPIGDYDDLWINTRTLFRNLMGSLDKEGVSQITPDLAAHALEEEIHQIQHLLRDTTHDRLKPVFYFSNYADLDKRYKHALLRMDSTEKQKDYTRIQRLAFERLFKLLGPDQIEGFNFKLQPKRHCRSLLLSHYTIDLTCDRAFGSLALLESHTGKIKKKAEWYTKYHQGRELAQIPFREDFLQIFGDTETFRPLNLSWRKELLELAQKYHWTSITTEAKLKYGIEQLRDHFMRKQILEIMHST